VPAARRPRSGSENVPEESLPSEVGGGPVRADGRLTRTTLRGPDLETRGEKNLVYARNPFEKTFKVEFIRGQYTAI
jgi:hypothetical protein